MKSANATVISRTWILCELLLSTMKLASAAVAVPFRCSAVQQCQVQPSCHHHHRLVKTHHHIPLVTGTPSRHHLQRLCMTLDQHCHGDQRLERVHTPAALHLTINSLTCQTPEPVSCRLRCCIRVVCRVAPDMIFSNLAGAGFGIANPAGAECFLSCEPM